MKEITYQGVTYSVYERNINTIMAGDTIIHNGRLRTVSANDITHDTFMGTKLFGDSYNFGYKPVKKVSI